jgi:antitoxin component of MazEF toxin-antitoxin module
MSNSFIVELVEDETGELVLPIPPELINELDWQIGDTIVFSIVDATVILTNPDADKRQGVLTVDK